MMRFLILFLMAVAGPCLALAGCDDDGAGEADADADADADGDAEPGGSTDGSGAALRVSAAVQSNGNPTEATLIMVGLFDMNLPGTAIAGAVVRVNGMVVPEEDPGAYTLLLTDDPITAGTDVTLEVDCYAGKANVSGVMPESGGETRLPVPGCDPDSYLGLANNI